MGVTIDDVARAAGMSPTVVSHTLSGRRPVSDATKARVLQAISITGYVPDRSAQSLARGRSSTIGLIVPDIADGFFSALAKSVEQHAIANGYNLMLGTSGWELERELFYVATLKSSAVDGLIYASGSTGQASPELAELFKGFPVVAVDDELHGLASASIVSDNLSGGELAARHLAELGHKRALILGENPHLPSIAARTAGFIATWRECGLPEPTLVRGPLTEDAGYRLAIQHGDVAAGQVPSAIFALNDVIALGALRALRELQVGVPSRCSVVGFDDISVAKNSWPPLTTVRQDVSAMGTLAVQSLVDQLDGGAKAEDVVIPVELIVRESSGVIGE